MRKCGVKFASRRLYIIHTIVERLGERVLTIQDPLKANRRGPVDVGQAKRGFKMIDEVCKEAQSAGEWARSPQNTLSRNHSSSPHINTNNSRTATTPSSSNKRRKLESTTNEQGRWWDEPALAEAWVVGR
jgi:hypothetical protein